MNMRESSSTANWFPPFWTQLSEREVKPRREAACPEPVALDEVLDLIVAVRVTKKTRLKRMEGLPNRT